MTTEGNGATEVDKLAAQIATLEAQNTELAAANKGFVSQVETLMVKAGQVDARTKSLGDVKTTLEAAQTAHRAEVDNHAKTRNSLLGIRRTNITINHGVPADKLVNLTDEQLSALEATLPSVKLNGKGLDLGGSGQASGQRTPTENALSILAKAKERAGVKV